ncbi:MAG: hypothetical protein JWL71_3190 [Acidobacteria bacterium]|nr:hypothetical protein [Acidobacteriota bacterium]
MSNSAKIFCLPGLAINTNQRRTKPLAVANATGKIFLQRSDHQLTLQTYTWPLGSVTR